MKEKAFMHCTLYLQLVEMLVPTVLFDQSYRNASWSDESIFDFQCTARYTQELQKLIQKWRGTLFPGTTEVLLLDV